MEWILVLIQNYDHCNHCFFVFWMHPEDKDGERNKGTGHCHIDYAQPLMVHYLDYLVQEIKTMDMEKERNRSNTMMEVAIRNGRAHIDYVCEILKRGRVDGSEDHSFHW